MRTVTKFFILAILWIFIVSHVAASDYCLPIPNNVTVEIVNEGNWTNVTFRTEPCFVWQDAGDGQVYGEPCAGVTFTSNVTCGIVPFAVQYTDHSTGASSWFWDFGDGVNSTDQNPVITYTTTGVYDVDHSASDGTTEWYNLSGYLTARPVGDTCAGGDNYDSDHYSGNWFTSWWI
jgi:hypothetical protein